MEITMRKATRLPRIACFGGLQLARDRRIQESAVIASMKAQISFYSSYERQIKAIAGARIAGLESKLNGFRSILLSSFALSVAVSTGLWGRISAKSDLSRLILTPLPQTLWSYFFLSEIVYPTWFGKRNWTSLSSLHHKQLAIKDLDS
jgi:hypothetical protein